MGLFLRAYLDKTYSLPVHVDRSGKWTNFHLNHSQYIWVGGDYYVPKRGLSGMDWLILDSLGLTVSCRCKLNSFPINSQLRYIKAIVYRHMCLIRSLLCWPIGYSVTWSSFWTFGECLASLFHFRAYKVCAVSGKSMHHNKSCSWCVLFLLQWGLNLDRSLCFAIFWKPILRNFGGGLFLGEKYFTAPWIGDGITISTRLKQSFNVFVFVLFLDLLLAKNTTNKVLANQVQQLQLPWILYCNIAYHAFF